MIIQSERTIEVQLSKVLCCFLGYNYCFHANYFQPI